MLDPQRLLDQFLGSGAQNQTADAPAATGGPLDAIPGSLKGFGGGLAAGGLAGLLLGTKKGRKMAGKAAKIGGIAVHRRRNRVLIQGSIERRDALGADRDREFLLGLAAALQAPAEEIDDLTPEEEMRSVELAIRRYGIHEWNRRVWEPQGSDPAETVAGSQKEDAR